MKNTKKIIESQKMYTIKNKKDNRRRGKKCHERKISMGRGRGIIPMKRRGEGRGWGRIDEMWRGGRGKGGENWWFHGCPRYLVWLSIG